MVHSAALAENEWKKAKPWNPPTQLTLAPGQSKIYAVKFVIADSIRHIEKTLEENRRPVAVGIPGYILPMDIGRSEEHTSELQSLTNLVCRLLLEKKK